MPQYSVPQFVDVEDKIFGPLTLKQFFVFLGGAGSVALLYKVVPNIIVFLIAAVPIGAATLILSFGSYNGRSMGYLISSVTGFFSEPRAFLFQKAGAAGADKKQEEAVVSVGYSTEEKMSRLHKLTYILDQDVKIEEDIIKNRGDSGPR